MMTRYYAEADNVALPELVPGTANRLAYPRANTPLACVLAPRSREFTTGHPDPDIIWSAKFTVIMSNYHVIPTIGHQHVTMPSDVNMMHEPPSFRPYRLSNTRAPRATREYLEAVWDGEVTVLTLERTLPALLMGQIEDVADGDTIDTGYGTFVLMPGWWLIRELSGRGTRLVSPLHLREEFESISGPPVVI